jgi:hypothetical protein
MGQDTRYGNRKEKPGKKINGRARLLFLQVRTLKPQA